MAYQLLDERLNLWSCGLGDLKAEQAMTFLNLWHDGSTLNGLSLFYEPDTQRVVINADNEHHMRFLKLALNYLSADEKARDNMRIAFMSEPIREAVKTLDRAIQDRKDKREMFILSQQYVTNEYDLRESMAQAIRKRYSSSGELFLIEMAFLYGIVQGKRMERRKRKKVQV